jgi:hypothetical protein
MSDTITDFKNGIDRLRAEQPDVRVNHALLGATVHGAVEKAINPYIVKRLDAWPGAPQQTILFGCAVYMGESIPPDEIHFHYIDSKGEARCKKIVGVGEDDDRPT